MSEAKEGKRKNPAESEESRQPVHVIRRGAIAASVWQRQAPSGYPYYDFRALCSTHEAA